MIWFIIFILFIAIIPVIYKMNIQVDDDMTVTIVALLIAIVMFLCITAGFFLNRGETKDMYLELQETYQGLNYKIEKLNENFFDKFSFINNDIINEVADYNKAVLTLQRQNKSPWLNWFVVNDVENLQLIDYAKFNFNEE